MYIHIYTVYGLGVGIGTERHPSKYWRRQTEEEGTDL
jgi:hypothetical protein